MEENGQHLLMADQVLTEGDAQEIEGEPVVLDSESDTVRFLLDDGRAICSTRPRSGQPSSR